MALVERILSGSHGAADSPIVMLRSCPCTRLLAPPPSHSEAPQAFCRGEHMGRVGFDPRSFFPWDGRSTVSHPTCDVPFPPRRTGEYRKGMISARPLYQGVRRSVWDPQPRESGSPKGVLQGQTESGGIVLPVICWSPSAQRRCDPTGRCAYRPSVTS